MGIKVCFYIHGTFGWYRNILLGIAFSLFPDLKDTMKKSCFKRL